MGWFPDVERSIYELLGRLSIFAVRRRAFSCWLVVAGWRFSSQVGSFAEWMIDFRFSGSTLVDVSMQIKSSHPDTRDRKGGPLQFMLCIGG